MDIKIKKLNKNNFDNFFKILNEMNLWAHKTEMEKGSKIRLKKHYFARIELIFCILQNNK